MIVRVAAPGAGLLPFPTFPEPALASPLPVCPFCKGAIAADVLRFGGNCPHCMLEIPGEEAPTDPGLQARLKKEQEDKVRLAAAKKKSQRLGALAALAAVLLVGGGTFAWREYQASLTYDMDDYFEFPLEDLSAAAPEAPPPEPTPEAGQGGRTGQGGRRSAVGSGSVAFADPPSNPEGGPKSATGGRSTQDIRPDGVSAGTGSDISLGGGMIRVEQVGSDVVLTDDQQIFDMAKRVIAASSPQLTSCYNQRLKQVESLKGAWEVSLVITRDGTTKNVKAVGVNGADGDLEGCIVRAVSAWKFQRIVKDIPVKKVYRFGASSWG